MIAVLFQGVFFLFNLKSKIIYLKANNKNKTNEKKIVFKK